jgi:hypothetical protein
MAIDLKKLEQQKEDIKIDLKKKGIENPPIIRLGGAWDLSGSTRDSFFAGHYEQVGESVMAVAGVLDDNGSMEMFGYSDEAVQFEDANLKAYGSYVKDHILGEHTLDKWNGTHWHAGMSLILDFYFGEKPVVQKVKEAGKGLFGKVKNLFSSHEEPAVEEEEDGDPNAPVFMMFLTDGEDSCPSETDEVLANSQDKNILWVMIGVDMTSKGRRALQALDARWPNVTFVDMPLTGLSSKEIYDKLFTPKAVKFLNAASKAAHAGA